VSVGASVLAVAILAYFGGFRHETRQLLWRRLRKVVRLA
jgi:hypothetical protein